MGRRHDDERERLLAFQTLLDGSRAAREPHVELNTLRKLCARGIPEYPAHLRPLAYALLLGTLPADKRAWKRTARAQREEYYNRVRHFMDELETAPPPTDPASPEDALLSRVSKDVVRAERIAHLLSSHTTPSPSSPLAPPGDGTSYGSSSSDDEPTLNEDEGRREHSARPRVRRQPLLSRRAIFIRIEHIEEASRYPSQKGKQREVSDDDSQRGLLSPKIVLSPDADGSSSQTPHPDNFARAISNSAPSLSLTIPGGDSAPSPITLLSPQNLQGRRAPASLFQPDTHAEALKRLLYVFCRANPHLPYAPTFVDILVPLYLVFAEAGSASQTHAPQARHAEEETYWAFSALMAELGDVVSATAGDDSQVTIALQRLGRQMRWADEPLWNILCSRNLDPSLPLYTFQWVTGLMTHDKKHLIPIWDHVFSQPPPTSDSKPRLESLINLSVAMICLLKRNIMVPPPPSPSKRHRDMWHGAAEMDTYPTTIEEEDPDASFVRCLQLFRNYPLDQLGGAPALLYTAFELKQELQAASLQGTDPDAPGWAESRDAKTQSGWGAWSFRQATPQSGKATWSRYSESDAAASLAKASSNLTATAMAKWSTAPAVPSWKSVGAVAGKWWKTAPKDDESFDGSEYDQFSSMPSTPGRSPHHNRSLSPEKRSNQQGNTESRGRSGSGASASGLSVSSLQDRLSGLASSLGHGTPNGSPQPRTASGPRPLLLSSSARRASSSAANRPLPSSPSAGSRALTTPPPMGDHGGLYRIRSHGRRSPMKRSSLADSTASDSKRDTIDSHSTQYTALSFGSDTDSRRDSASTPYDSVGTPYDSDTVAALKAIQESGTLNEHPTPRVSPAVSPPAPLPALTINTAPTISPSISTATLQPEPPSPAEAISIPTPKTSHLTEDDYDHVYEPAEDSFILLDALEEDARVLRSEQPALCVEIGSGSGICSTFITSVLGVTDTFVLSTDINAYAANATQRTGEANGAPLNPVLCNLLDPLQSRLTGQIDLLVFNPPYVETEEAEMTATQQQRDIGGAWAGGNFGMTVTNLVLDRLPGLLASGGRFYLVAIEQNKPKEIVARMRATGLECKVVMKRRAGRELLSVIRMIRPAGLHVPTPQSYSPLSPGSDYGQLLEAYA